MTLKLLLAEGERRGRRTIVEGTEVEPAGCCRVFGIRFRECRNGFAEVRCGSVDKARNSLTNAIRRDLYRPDLVTRTDRFPGLVGHHRTRRTQCQGRQKPDCCSLDHFGQYNNLQFPR